MKKLSFLMLGAASLLAITACGNNDNGRSKFKKEAEKACAQESGSNYATITMSMHSVVTGYPGREDVDQTTDYEYHFALEEVEGEEETGEGEEGTTTVEWVCQEEIPEGDEQQTSNVQMITSYLSTNALLAVEAIEAMDGQEILPGMKQSYKFFVEPLSIYSKMTMKQSESGMTTEVIVEGTETFNQFGEVVLVEAVQSQTVKGKTGGMTIDMSSNSTLLIGITYSLVA